jgi:hypothetical protein
VIREMLQAGWLGKIERLWNGETPGVDPITPAPMDQANPEGREFDIPLLLMVDKVTGGTNATRVRLVTPSGKPHNGTQIQGGTAVNAAKGLFSTSSPPVSAPPPRITPRRRRLPTWSISSIPCAVPATGRNHWR